MTELNTLTIPLEDLQLDLLNPRYRHQSNQREALTTLATHQGPKLIALAEDIVNRGLNPTDLPMVVEIEESGLYTVVEGNRRVAALKLATSPQLLESIDISKSLKQRFKKLHNQHNASLPREILCAIFPTRDDANHWIHLKHTGENKGIGVVSWDGAATERFRGNSPALQAIDLVEKSSYLNEETRKKLSQIPITNVGRILDTPEARQLLGVDVKKRELSFVSDPATATARLALIIDDIANRRIKVTDLDTKEQRVAYVKNIVSQALPQPNGGSSQTSSTSSKPTKTTSSGRKISAERDTVIPKQFKIKIHHTRINSIYNELQNLQVERFPNSCAVMLRVFLELSLVYFASQKHISLMTVPKPGTNAKPRDMSLREKIDTIIKYFEDNNLCNPADLRGIRAVHANRDHFLSIDSLNAYVHNHNFSPAPSDLKAHWESIQPFIEHLWAQI